METTLEHERDKYTQMWDWGAYHKNSPGERHVKSGIFGEMCDPVAGKSCIDLGCGTGRGGAMLAEKHGLKVTYLDMVDARDLGLRAEPFFEQSLWHELPSRSPQWQYGFNSDVMEHIPTEYTMLVVRNILKVCRNTFFAISFRDDPWGRLVGQNLHITVRPFLWWYEHLNDIGLVMSARDLLGEGVFHVRSR